MHWASLCFFSLLIPHGDFLLHMGYNHKGINFNCAIEEPFPLDFEIPLAVRGYQGYLKKTRGGFFYFFLLGYLKSFLIFLRMSLILGYYFTEDTGPIDKMKTIEPMILMILMGYTLFNALMVIKGLFENLPMCRGLGKVVCCGK